MPNATYKKTAQREALFVAHYLKTLDGTASAIACGMSTKSAAQAGKRLLQRPSVIAALRAKQAVQVARVDMDAERVKTEIFALATLDIAHCFSKDTGLPIAIHELPPEVRACVKEVSVDILPSGAVRSRIAFWDKVAALKLAAQHLALLAPKEVTIHHRFPFASLTDAELKQKMLQSAKELPE